MNSRGLAGLHICPVVLVLCLFSGCKTSPYEIAPVSGTVKLDDKPLVGAVVNFQPIAKRGNDAGPGSTGRTDENGKFRLITIDRFDGAVVGEHRVRIYSYSPESPNSSDVDDENTPSEKVPEQYNYKSKLTFTVLSDGTEAADFDL